MVDETFKMRLESELSVCGYRKCFHSQKNWPQLTPVIHAGQLLWCMHISPPPLYIVTRIMTFTLGNRRLVEVTKNEMNKDNQLVICHGCWQRIELSQYGQLNHTIIETLYNILNFSILVQDRIKRKVWLWARGEKITQLLCAHSVPEFKWKFKDRHQFFKLTLLPPPITRPQNINAI